VQIKEVEESIKKTPKEFSKSGVKVELGVPSWSELFRQTKEELMMVSSPFFVSELGINDRVLLPVCM